MNLESNPSKKQNIIVPQDDFDFDFKPITDGLGFHGNKTTEVKPAFNEMPSISLNQMSMPMPSIVRKEQTAYQNEYSAFYAQETVKAPVELPKTEKVYRLATKSQRVLAYFLDLGFLFSCLGIVLTVMARTIHMDLLEVWAAYPNEITPLVVTLFAGFYMMYFAIFEKTSSSTIGKNLLNIMVVNSENKPQNFTMLMFRTFISLTNFVSLGLFSYFDLQNKVSNSKVIKVD